MNIIKVLMILTVIVLLNACNTTKYLKDDEVLLDYLEVALVTDQNLPNASNLTDQLKQFYRQTPNSNFLFIPREWYFYKNQDAGDTTWIKNWSKKSLGEEPALLDTQLIYQSASDMQNYLRHPSIQYICYR